MDGGGPMGRGGGRDLRELIPGRRKTVELEAQSRSQIIGGLFMILLMFGLPGLLFVWGALKTLADSLLKHDWSGIGLAGMFALGGSVLAFPFLLILYVLFDSSRCLPMGTLSERLNVSEEALHQLAQEKAILPRYNVGGRMVYRLSDFDSFSLLRASTAPVKPDELVRAVSDTSTPSDMLLRKSGPPDMLAKADGGEQ